MNTYHARVAREGKWWIIRVTDFDLAVTQARRLTEVDGMARDLIASLLDIDPHSFDLSVTLDAIEDANLTAIKDAQSSSRAELDQAQRAYSERLRSDARRLAANGLVARDIGYVLGVSHQRAAQLLDEDRAKATTLS